MMGDNQGGFIGKNVLGTSGSVGHLPKNYRNSYEKYLLRGNRFENGGSHLIPGKPKKGQGEGSGRAQFNWARGKIRSLCSLE